ncbi:MAG: hypothetical protein LBH98_09720 [Chitinispirillales bacterium]|jgi:hypothetical protein|nr:hypothetical protein [Chitinispirillales bacterium]
MHHKSMILCLAILLLSISAFGQKKEFTIPYKYTASNDDSRNSAKAKAMEEAQSSLLQQLGVLVEARQKMTTTAANKTKQEDFVEELKTYTIGKVQTQIVTGTEKFTENDKGDMIYSATFKMLVDTVDLYKYLDNIVKQKEQARLDDINKQQKIQTLRKETEELKKQTEAAKAKESELYKTRLIAQKRLAELKIQKDDAEKDYKNTLTASNASTSAGMAKTRATSNHLTETTNQYNAQDAECKKLEIAYTTAQNNTKIAENNLYNAEVLLANEAGTPKPEKPVAEKSPDIQKNEQTAQTAIQLPIPASTTAESASDKVITYNTDSRVTVINWNDIQVTINTLGDLRAFRDRVNARNDFSGQTFILADNISLEGDNQWVPIGTKSGNTAIPFNGTFDGDGKVVKGINIGGNNDRQGLFGFVDNMATVKNLGIINVNIKGNTRIGGLVGSNAGIIENCYVSGNIIVMGTDYVGGLVGISVEGGRIENCYAAGNIGGNSYIGGLVGENGGTIDNCYISGGNVRGTKENSGGLVGKNTGTIGNCYAIVGVTGIGNVGGLAGRSQGTIKNCYATGNVAGTTSVGGLMGITDLGRSITINCYATGNVKGNNNVGGLLGQHGETWWNCDITNCYAVGNVKGDNNVGGLVGYNKYNTSNKITNSYYDTQTSGQFDGQKGKPVATEDMKKQSTYSGWDFTKTWGISPNTNNGYPYLKK